MTGRGSNRWGQTQLRETRRRGRRWYRSNRQARAFVPRGLTVHGENAREAREAGRRFVADMAVLLEFTQACVPYAGIYAVLVQRTVTAARAYMRGEVTEDHEDLHSWRLKRAAWRIRDGRIYDSEPGPRLAVEGAFSITKGLWDAENLAHDVRHMVDWAREFGIRLTGEPQW